MIVIMLPQYKSHPPSFNTFLWSRCEQLKLMRQIDHNNPFESNATYSHIHADKIKIALHSLCQIQPPLQGKERLCCFEDDLVLE